LKKWATSAPNTILKTTNEQVGGIRTISNSTRHAASIRLAANLLLCGIYARFANSTVGFRWNIQLKSEQLKSEMPEHA
jgi:hypothetical protein